MNKVTYFRKRVMERYENNELAGAARSGEALLQEHLDNETCWGMAYADDLYNLACIYDKMGHNDRAAELYMLSARMTFVETGEELPFANRLNNLGAVLNRLGKSEAAYRLYRNMTHILREKLDPASPELADGLYNLANTAAETGRVDEALRLHGEALAIRENAGDPLDKVNSLHSLAFLYEEKGEVEMAIRYAEMAMACAAETEAYEGACYYLAGLYDINGPQEKAVPLFATVLRWVVRRAGGRNHSAYVTVASRLAGTLVQLREYRRALALQYVIGDILKKRTGEQHAFYANCLRSMALLQKRLNEPDKALSSMRASIEIRNRVMGEQVRDLTADALFMIELYVAQGEYDRSIEMLVYLLMQAGSGQPDFERVLNRLTDIYTRAGSEPFQQVLAEIEKLNEPGRLWQIVKSWSNPPEKN